MKAFQKEISTLKTLRHQFIINYYDDLLLKEENLLVIKMELADGSLNDLLEENKLPYLMAIEYFREICCACRYLHEHEKIVHGDLKPLNILLKDGKVIKIN